MLNFKDHYPEISGEFVDTYWAMYMKGQWGIEVGYIPYPDYWVNYRLQLAEYQINSDCTKSLCAQSQTSGF